MNVHKKLIGDGAELYLPFALSKARFFNSVWTAPVVKVIQSDYVLISISIPDKDLCHVTIISDSVGYDFCALETPTTEGFLPSNHASMVRSSMYRRARGLTSTVFSGVPAWNVAQYPYAVPTYAGVNRQRFAQRMRVPYDATPSMSTRSNSKPYAVESSIGIASYANRFDRRWTTFGWPRALLFAPVEANTYQYWTPDHLFDVPTSYYSTSRTLAAVPAPSAPLWFRRAAVRVVSGRRFFIHTDAHSNFYAYAVEATADPRTFGYSVPASKYVKVAAASFLPAGTAVPSMSTLGPGADGGATVATMNVVLGEGQVNVDAPYVPHDYTGLYPDFESGWNGNDTYQHNHYVWAFNADCTKAAAVVYVDEFDRYQTETSLVPLDTVGTPRPYRRFKAGMSNVSVNHYTEADAAAATKLSDAGGLTTATVALRAIVEVDLNLEVTGPGAMDFTFTVTHARTLTGRFFVDADYIYNDSRLLQLGAVPGELVTASFEQYARRDVVGGDPLSEGTPELWDPNTTLLHGGQVRTIGALCVRRGSGELLRAFRMTETRFAATKINLSSTYIGNISASVPASPYGRDISYSNLDYTFRVTLYTPTLVRQFARLLGMDLRSMSFAVEVYRNLNAATSTASPLEIGVSLSAVSYAYNSVLDAPHPAFSGYLGEAFPPLPESGVAWVEVPYGYKTPPGAYALETHTEYVDHYRQHWEAIADAYSLYGGVASHPDGHSSFAGVSEDFNAGVLGVDWIQHARRTPSGPVIRRKNHMQEFNAAYNQARVSADYASDGVYYDGTVKAYGVWRSFAPAPFPYKLSV